MTTPRYSDRTVWIHWLSAILIFMLIATGIRMEHGEHSMIRLALYQIHFLLGIGVFILTLVRVVALWRDERPEGLYPESSLHQRFIRFVHYGFYVVLMWMCISGIASIFLEGILPALLSGEFADLPDIREDGFHPIMMSHHIVAKFIFLLLIFHILGYLIHLLRYRDNSLKRIWF